MIKFSTAMVLYALLLLAAVLNLHGPPLYLALLIVLALAVKSYVHHLRGRLE